MTSNQVLAGFKRLGGITKENAAILTIEKYSGSQREKLWKSCTRKYDKHYPGARNCPLCIERLTTSDSESHNCSECILFVKSKGYTCTDVRSDFIKMMLALKSNGRQMFDCYCDKIVKTCQRYLNRLEKKERKK